MPESANYSPYGHPKGHTDANGNWVRNVDVAPDGGADGASFEQKILISYAMADEAVLMTASEPIQITDLFWEITKAYTGGTASTIGVSSSLSPFDTKGDLLGGAAGDGASNLVPGISAGTKGPELAGGPIILTAGATIRLDRITSAFTAGEGFLHIVGRQVT
jgi:hypothetical protein